MFDPGSMLARFWHHFGNILSSKISHFWNHFHWNFGVHFRSDSGYCLSSILTPFSEYLGRNRAVLDVKIELPVSSSSGARFPGLWEFCRQKRTPKKRVISEAVFGRFVTPIWSSFGPPKCSNSQDKLVAIFVHYPDVGTQRKASQLIATHRKSAGLKRALERYGQKNYQ